MKGACVEFKESNVPRVPLLYRAIRRVFVWLCSLIEVEAGNIVIQLSYSVTFNHFDFDICLFYDVLVILSMTQCENLHELKGMK